MLLNTQPGSLTGCIRPHFHRAAWGPDPCLHIGKYVCRVHFIPSLIFSSPPELEGARPLSLPPFSTPWTDTANITADIEQLLAELVTITLKIATLVNATAALSNAPDDSDSLASTANRLSLSAAIIAVAAFLIASLQAILEYASSGESVRRKCNEAAIGALSRLVKTRWSFRHWRRKVYYPDLVIDLDPIIKRNLSVQDVRRMVENIHMRPTMWDAVKHDVGLRLPLGRVLRRRWRHIWIPKNVDFRPRATYVQLLSSAGLDAVDLCENDEMGFVYRDADSISASLDVPALSVRASTLAKLAILIGCTDVKIDDEERTVDACSDVGSITTEVLPGYGKVVRFQQHGAHMTGYLADDHARTHHITTWKGHSARLMSGEFDIDVLSPNAP
ncbi:hypothetical protein F5Y17DRAFT_450307 [Xylariaceae sp. FL0594]|nr:hypothetical protein F5Y17DRAFT_450307 [Xylariaceae sp. FL0594]